MKTENLIIELKKSCLNSYIADVAIKKLLDVEAYTTKKDVHVTMSQNDYKEFLNFKVLKSIIKSEYSELF